MQLALEKRNFNKSMSWELKFLFSSPKAEMNSAIKTLYKWLPFFKGLKIFVGLSSLKKNFLSKFVKMH